MTVVKTIENTNYSLVLEEGRYAIYDNGSVMQSPGGNPVTTGYEDIALKLMDDLKTFGYAMNNSSSMLSWHFDLLDKFLKMGMKEIIYSIMANLLNSPQRDWTMNCPYQDDSIVTEWEDVFGSKAQMEDRLQIVADWLNACTRMQLAAANAMSRKYDSFNLAYLLARAIEYDESPEQLINMTVKYHPGHTAAEMQEDFERYLLYYGVHVDDYKRTDPVEGEVDEETANEFIKALLK